jgi:hypothetical protein
MGDFNTYVNGTIDQLVTVNNMLRNQGVSVQSVFLGGGNIQRFKGAYNPTDADEVFFKDIFTQSASSTSFGAIAPVLDTNHNPTNVVYNTNHPGTYSSFLTSGAAADVTMDTGTSYGWANNATINPAVLDVNLYKWVTTKTGSALVLQKLYFLHDLFKTQNWTHYYQGTNTQIYLQGFDQNGNYLTSVKLVTISPYTLGAGEYDVLQSGSGSVPIVKIGDLQNMNSTNNLDLTALSGVLNLNTLLFRRVFYLFIRMAQFKIADVAYTNSPGPTPPATGLTATQQTLSNVRQSQLMLLYLANKLVDTYSDFNQQVFSNTATSQSTLRATAGNLQSLNTTISAGKQVMSTNINSIQSNKSSQKRVKTFEYVVLAFVFTSIAAATALSFVGEENRMKYSVAMLACTIVFVPVMLFAYQHYIGSEHFTDVSIDVSSGSVETAFMANVFAYMYNTMNVNTFLESYELTYSMNQTMNQEQANYKIASNDIDVSGQRLYGISKIVQLDKLDTGSRVYTLLVILAVIGLFMPLYVLMHEYIRVQQTILAVAAAIIVIALVIQVYQTTSRVRNDGEKKYWGQPSAFNNAS